MEGSLSNYIRTHRKRIGLRQSELARILGYNSKVTISRHERVFALPSLLAALGYEVLFAIPVSDLFAGMREAVAQAIDTRLGELEKDLLQEQERRGARAQTLNWIASRRKSLHPSSQ
jgi:DNA-binding XRE family transcriptional regulator